MKKEIKKRICIIHFIFAFFFGVILVCSLCGCFTSFSKVEITQTMPLTQEEIDIFSYQHALRHNPKRILAMPTCQWQAMHNYIQFKEKGYEACILIGRSNKWGGQKHFEATVLKEGIPIDLKEMKVTYIITEEKIWRIE